LQRQIASVFVDTINGKPTAANLSALVSAPDVAGQAPPADSIIAMYIPTGVIV